MSVASAIIVEQPKRGKLMDPIRCERNFIKDTINKTEIETDTIAERYRFFFVQGIVTRIMKENKMPQDKIR